MADVVIGHKSRPEIIDQLLHHLVPLAGEDGTIYVGYPLLRRSQGAPFVDLLITSTDCGLVAVDVSDDVPLDETAERQDDLYADIAAMLYGHKPLRRGRDLAVSVIALSVVPPAHLASLVGRHGRDSVADRHVTDPDGVADLVTRVRSPMRPELAREVNAVLQRVTTLRPQNKRTKVTRPDSRGAKIREIESEIANLDKWQKRAAIETPEGPQRLRGLAGSGKTVVLALKAADLLARHPDWRVLLTFYTRSLYQHLRALVGRFSLSMSGEDPDFDRLHVRHGWGSAREPGFYSTLAAHVGASARDFLSAKAQLGGSFERVCAELLEGIRAQGGCEPLYDAILIDEAQDFPQPFFELAYLAAKEPKRIVWAYDELQNLGEYSMKPPEELFGRDEHGAPRVPELVNERNQPQRDVILPVCYRNTPWALTAAHAVGFGIYSSQGLVQFFDDPQLWSDIGYEIRSGRVSPGENVVLRRAPTASPAFFDRLLQPADAISWQVFKDADEQAVWLAESIRRSIKEEELDAKDVLVILPDAYRVNKDAGAIINALRSRGLESHIAGVTSSRDELFVDGSIAISGIYRAKGNEAPLVYVAHAEYGLESRYEAIRRRNTLFTGMTRSRAWLRITGIGPAMVRLGRELEAVRSRQFALAFRVPTGDELEKLRRIHRDMSSEERARARQAEEALEKAVREIQTGTLSVENLPAELVDQLRDLLAKRGDAGE